MSFFLDAFLFFGLGIVLFVASRYVEKRLPKWWHRRQSVIAAAFFTLFFDGTSVSLYYDNTGTGVVYGFLKAAIGVQDPSGSYIMLHTNVTNLTSANMPLYAVIVLFALYPFWVYLGYSTASHTLVERTGLKESGVVSSYRQRLRRFGGEIGISAGGCIMIFGLVRFPGGLLRQSDLAAFGVTMVGIGVLLCGVTLAATISTSLQPTKIQGVTRANDSSR